MRRSEEKLGGAIRLPSKGGGRGGGGGEGRGGGVGTCQSRRRRMFTSRVGAGWCSQTWRGREVEERRRGGRKGEGGEEEKEEEEKEYVRIVDGERSPAGSELGGAHRGRRLSKIWVTTITRSVEKILAAKKMLQPPTTLLPKFAGNE